MCSSHRPGDAACHDRSTVDFSSVRRCWLSLQLPFGAKCSIRHVLGLIIPDAMRSDQGAAGWTSYDSLSTPQPLLWPPECYARCQATTGHLKRCVLSGEEQAGRQQWWLGGVGGVHSSHQGSWTQHDDSHYMVLNADFFISDTVCVCVSQPSLTTSRRNTPPPSPDRPGCNGTNWAGHHRGTAGYLLWQDPLYPFNICKIW